MLLNGILMEIKKIKRVIGKMPSRSAQLKSLKNKDFPKQKLREIVAAYVPHRTQSHGDRGYDGVDLKISQQTHA